MRAVVLAFLLVVFNAQGRKLETLSAKGTKGPFKLVFFSNEKSVYAPELWAMNIDGSKRRRVFAAPQYQTIETLALSRDGTKIAYEGSYPGNLPSSAELDRLLGIFLWDGTKLQRLTNRGGQPAFSPDGKKIVFTRDGDLVLLDLHSMLFKQLMATSAIESQPVFSTGGSMIAFRSKNGSQEDMCTISANGGNSKYWTHHSAGTWCSAPSLSSDGKKLVYSYRSRGRFVIEIISLRDGRSTDVSLPQGFFTGREDTAGSFCFTPDNTKLLFEGYIDGQYKIYTIDLNGSKLKNLSKEHFADMNPVVPLGRSGGW